MKITTVSDLHLEFADYNLHNDMGANVLILGGDIFVAQDLHDFKDHDVELPIEGLSRRQETVSRARHLIKTASKAYDHVILIAGNHEFYHGKFFKGLDYIREEVAPYDNVYFLEDEHVELDGVTFVGATLWTDFNKQDPHTKYLVENYLNDYKTIRNDQEGYRRIKTNDVLQRHLNSVKYISKVVSETEGPVVVCTHHSPSFMSVHESYKDDTLMNGGYHSDLSELILDHPNIKLWTHGHTHFAFDYTIGDTRIVCNPRGYITQTFTEETGYDPDLVIEIDTAQTV